MKVYGVFDAFDAPLRAAADTSPCLPKLPKMAPGLEAALTVNATKAVKQWDNITITD
jgi:hypothetical protein